MNSPDPQNEPSPQGESPALSPAVVIARPVGRVGDRPAAPGGEAAVIARPAAAARMFPDPRLMSRGEASLDLLWVAAGILAPMVLLGVLQTLIARYVPADSEIVVHVAGISVVLLSVAIWRLRRHSQSPAMIGLRTITVREAAGYGLLAWIGCLGLNLLVVPLVLFASGASFEELTAERVETARMFAATPAWWVLPLSIYVGVYEEIIFRGLMLARLSVLFGAWRWPPVVISAVVFAVLHAPQGGLAVVQIFLMGVVFALVAAWRRSIWPVIVAHALWDSMAFVLSRVLPDLLEQAASSASQPVP